jgi:hypothetical protein
MDIASNLSWLAQGLYDDLAGLINNSAGYSYWIIPQT